MENKDNISAVQDFLQKTSVLEPSFLSSFKQKDKGKMIAARNIAKITEMSTPAEPNDNVIEASAKKPFTREVSNQIFDKIKAAPNFNERSRSVLSPQTLSAYTPIKKKA